MASSIAVDRANKIVRLTRLTIPQTEVKEKGYAWIYKRFFFEAHLKLIYSFAAQQEHCSI